MNSKKCIKCDSFNIIKYGYQGIHRRWKCKDCGLVFQANVRKNPLDREGLFFSFVFGKQNISELSLSYHIRKTKVQSEFDAYVLPIKKHKPRKINLVVDASYFTSSNEENKFCLIIFRDPKEKEDLWFKFCDTERESYYREGREYLERLGYTIKSMTSDGLALIRSAFSGIPHQTCLVHVRSGVQRKTTKNPVLEAGVALLALSKLIFKLDDKQMLSYILGYKKKYWNILNEKTTSEISGRTWYTHKELRDGFFLLYRDYPYMFTYLKDKKHIPRTSNTLEGHWRHVKVRVSVHHGLSLKRKQKLLQTIILNSSVKLKKNKIRNWE